MSYLTASPFLCPPFSLPWVVYSKRPFGGPKQVLKYLARYTHRVAISNARLVTVTQGKVAFRYKDYADGNEQKVLTLSADEFLRRFVQHVLPERFVKIRHYGLLANRRREWKLNVCRLLLAAQGESDASAQSDHAGVVIAEAAVPTCPKCGSSRIVSRELPACRRHCTALRRLTDSS